MNYETVFDASQQPFPYFAVLVPLFVLAVGMGLLRLRHTIPKLYRPIGTSVAWLVTLLSGFLLVAMFISTLTTRSRVQELLNDPMTPKVEGHVQDVSVTSGGRAESFVIGGVRFSYSEASASTGFHHTSAFGGPITEGLQVRILYAYLDGDPSVPAILKLDIAR